MKKRWAAWAVAAGLFARVVWYGIHRPTAPAPFTFQGISGVERLSLSPDGGLLAEASHAGQVAVFDTANGTRRYTLAVNAARMSFSSDGRRLLTRSRGGLPTKNGVVQIWDAATGAPLSRFVVPAGPPGAAPSAQPRVAALSADLRCVAVRDSAHCTLYDLASGRQIRALAAPPSRANDVSFSHDGSLLAVGSNSGPGGLQLWNTQTWRPLALGGQAGPVSSIRFSPDGTRVAALNAGCLTWWDTRPWKRAGGFSVPKVAGEELGWVFFSSDSGHLLVTRTGPTDRVFVVDCVTGRATMTLPNQMVANTSQSGGRAETVRLPTRSQIVFFRETHSIWDVTQGKELYRIAIPPGPGASQAVTLGGDWQLHSTDLSADGHVFAAGGYDDGILHVWHLP